MSTKVILLSLLSLSLFNLLQPAWSRSLSVSLNMSMTRKEIEDRNTTTPTLPAKITQELLQSCMRETEISMSQLKLFRLSLLFNENSNSDVEMPLGTGTGDDDMKNGNNLGDIDYDSMSQLPSLDLKRNEPLQCFVRCLYDGLGLIHYDMMLEEAFKMEVQNLMQRHKTELKECSKINSKNRCEAAYKLRLCYNHLNNLEAEQRLREVLERSETGNDSLLADNEEIENNLSGADKANEIVKDM